jgi:hypothetical protein
MADAGYTFLPWARRGMIAEIDVPDAETLDQRAVVRVGVTITNAGTGGVDVTILGPGDVTGLDTRLIVRTEPRPGTTSFEPNHLAAVDFDLPDLPWLVTPAGPAGNDLRPWIALVVVEQQPGVTVGLEPGAPLPVLRIDSPADALVELPPLASSRLWAHAQVLADADVAPAALPAELTDHPDENVSRLVCPRRLRAGVRYFACIVPTFDAGAVRGLGGVPTEGAALGPAWGSSPEVRLPVYYHWEFATGPEGDFETLAARLRPHASSAQVGRAPMHIGSAHPGIVELPTDTPGAIVDMDGALRAPAGSDLTLAQVPAPIRTGLRSAVNAATRTAAGQTAPLTVGPPLYGAWHANHHRLTDDAPEWVQELNSDPRTRVAAGLGAEVVRRNQEDLMHAAWTQLGDIRQANDRLNAARLSLEALRKVHARHLAPLPADRLLPLASPVHRHTLMSSAGGTVTVPEAVRPTSLPDAAMSPALRRLTSARQPMLRAVARRAGTTFAPAVLARLAPGYDAIDPNRFVPDGLVGMATLDGLSLPADGATPVDLTPLGIADTLPVTRLTAERERARVLAPMAEAKVDLRLRTTTVGAGLVGAAHIEALGAITGLGGDERASLMGQLAAAAANLQRASAYLVGVGGRTGFTIEALDLTADGSVTIRTKKNLPNVVVGRIDPALATGPDGLARVLRGLPPNTIDRTGSLLFNARKGPGGKIIIDRRKTLPPVGPPVLPPVILGARKRRVEATGAALVPTSLVIAPLVSDGSTVGRFRDAFAALGDRLQLSATPVTPVVVGFDVAAAATAVLERTDPRRTVVPRIAGIVRIGGLDFRTPQPGVSVAPTEDRIMAAPTFDVPSYLYLARYDRARFCPGIDEIPPDSVTILETNPRFVESFLIGLNHEMNRELLWRTYPTDQRGTSFRRFWDRFDGQVDIGPIHEFGAGRLGLHLVDAEPKLVLLVRGELLRRYPTAAVYAVRATATGRLSTDPADVSRPIFGGSFEPDVTFVGFDLADDELDDGNGWFFVIQQQPTEPRFGLDDPASRLTDDPATWQEAAWSDTGLAPGEHLAPAAIEAVGLGPLPHAGATAAALFQQPVRVAVHARHLVTEGS